MNIKRLTEKDYCGYDIKDRQNFNGYDDDKDCQKIFSCLQKLGKLEDIEEELGIDLITLFKAIKNGIWTKAGWYSNILEKEPVFVNRPEIGMCSTYGECDENFIPTFEDKNVMCIYTYDYEIMVRQSRLKDYGKTWALTKEELE